MKRQCIPRLNAALWDGDQVHRSSFHSFYSMDHWSLALRSTRSIILYGYIDDQRLQNPGMTHSMGYSGRVWSGQQLTPRASSLRISLLELLFLSGMFMFSIAEQFRCKHTHPTTLVGHLMHSQHLDKMFEFYPDWQDSSFNSSRWCGSSWIQQGCPVWAQERFISHILKFVLADGNLFARLQSPAGLNLMGFLLIFNNKIPW